MSLAKEFTLVPHISEKTYRLASEGVFVFRVDMTGNKLETRQAVEKQFGVTVTNVRSAVRKGKAKKSAQRRKQPIDGKRANYKLMYVTLKEGDSIPVFEEIN